MSIQIILVLILTLIIHLINTLAYAVRIVGARTRKIAISFTLFNIMVLVARTSHSFQAPLLAKWIENNINAGITPSTFEIRLILVTTSIATICGAILIPTFQRLLSKAVMNFSTHKSMPKLLLLSFSKRGFKQLGQVMKLPNKENFRIGLTVKFPLRIFLLNIIAVAILSVGVLSALYAAFLVPELRTTASTLSAIVNGIATILMLLIIDPYLAILMDDVIEGKYSEIEFRKIIRLMVFSTFLGTILAQLFLTPFSNFIAMIAKIL